MKMRGLALFAAAMVLVSTNGAVAQTRQPNNSAKSSTGARLSKAIEQASQSREFYSTAKANDADGIRKLLGKYGFSDPIEVGCNSDQCVPNYTGFCVWAPVYVYYPKPPYSWPNNGHYVLWLICDPGMTGWQTD
jgi:hypothetical protein